jgi:DNA-binding NarL/FixJ family response regulator
MYSVKENFIKNTNNPLQVKIFLIANSEIVRHSIKASLEKECIITGEASNGVEAIRKLENNLPDIILMEMNMPGMTGAECTRVLKQKHEEIKILIFSIHANEQNILALLFSGADGYILENFTIDELLFAIKKIMNNSLFISPKLTLNLLTRRQELKKEFTLPVSITDREMNVLKLIGEGLTNSEIAEKLFTSVRTIENRKKKLLDKTKTKNSATLIKYALKNGLLD